MKVISFEHIFISNTIEIKSNFSGPTTCPAASIVLSLSPITNVHRYVNALVSNEDGGSTTGSVVEKDNRLRMALATLCHWLCYWEGTPLLHQYIISFMKALQVNWFDCLSSKCGKSVFWSPLCLFFEGVEQIWNTIRRFNGGHLRAVRRVAVSRSSHHRRRCLLAYFSIDARFNRHFR